MIKKFIKFFEKSNVKKLRPGQLDASRFKIVVGLFYISFLVLAARATMIHLFPAGKIMLKHIAQRQYQESIDLAPYRGTIFDRRNIPMAISIRTPSLAINPKVFSPTNSEKHILSKLLNISNKDLEKIMSRDSYFAWLKRKVPHKTAKRIQSMDIQGLHQFIEPARFYPGGSNAANLIGYVGIDNKGLLGIEAKYNSFLSGEENKLLLSKDARGRPIFLNSSAAVPQQAGNNIHLTIDQAIQDITEEALKQAVANAQAKGGFAVVSDPYAGKILAIANYPTFNPNNVDGLNLNKTKNQAIANLFEPGSVMKPFVIASAIQKKITNFDSIHNCEKNGRYKIDRHNYIHDDHPKESLTTEEIIIHSSNICTVKIAQKLGNKGLYDSLAQFGFSPVKNLLGLMGEAHGRLSSWKNWRPIRLATISFGQGHLVNGLEIVRAYSALANGGSLVDPYLLERVESEKNNVISTGTNKRSIQLLDPIIAKKMRKVLERVVIEGTAKKAASDDYTTGGKTGTAEKVDPKLGGYSHDKRIASFAGFAPVDDPHIVVYVAIDEPRKKPYYGGLWAAPAFSQIVSQTLKYLNVAPDKKDNFRISTGNNNESAPKKI
ncbi:MAG: penicillin-binding protein 2 [Bdellovibrionota bacterium]